jgi:anti-sigma B factor antagonist
MNHPFDFQTHVTDRAAEVVLAGDLDMAATFKLEPALDRVLDDGEVEQVVLDVGDVPFVDSAGLGSLLSIRQRARERGIEMSIVNPSDALRRILDVTATHDLLDG